MIAMGALRKGGPALRVVGLLLLFAVFGLPLHSHALTETPRIAKECSCIHGTRTEAGLVAAVADWAPLPQAAFIEIVQSQIFSHSVVSFFSIRAPPIF
jgi:hypothetical protein